MPDGIEEVLRKYWGFDTFLPLTDADGRFNFNVTAGVFYLETESEGFTRAGCLIHYNSKYRQGSTDIIFVILSILPDDCPSVILAEE